MQILDYKQAESKVKRISLQILEKHLSLDRVQLLGINQSGFRLAQKIQKALSSYAESVVECHQLVVRAADPLATAPYITESPELDNKNIVIVDDVANTGRTIFYGLATLMNSKPLSVEALVLVDRQHKRYPILIDYVGLQLATTLQDHIRVQIDDQGIQAFLE